MSINETPTITLVTNGPAHVVSVACLQGPGGTDPDTSSTLVVQPSPAPQVASVALSPTDPRAVVVTPGTVAGAIQFFVSETPTADTNLRINVQVIAPPSVRQIVYVSDADVTPSLLARR